MLIASHHGAGRTRRSRVARWLASWLVSPCAPGRLAPEVRQLRQRGAPALRYALSSDICNGTLAARRTGHGMSINCREQGASVRVRTFAGKWTRESTDFLSRSTV